MATLRKYERLVEIFPSWDRCGIFINDDVWPLMVLAPEEMELISRPLLGRSDVCGLPTVIAKTPGTQSDMLRVWPIPDADYAVIECR